MLSHEVTHWMGAESYLDLDISGRFGEDSYAAEELVAELGAAFMCVDLGLANEPRSVSPLTLLPSRTNCPLLQ